MDNDRAGGRIQNRVVSRHYVLNWARNAASTLDPPSAVHAYETRKHTPILSESPMMAARLSLPKTASAGVTAATESEHDCDRRSQSHSSLSACCATASSRDDGWKPKSWPCGISSISSSSAGRADCICVGPTALCSSGSIVAALDVLVVKLTTRRLLDWHRSIAERPRRWRSRPSPSALRCPRSDASPLVSVSGLSSSVTSCRTSMSGEIPLA
jgi:hypothetical protein